MRRTIAIFFLAIFSVSFTEAGELLKLPLLVEHFADHNEGAKKISLTGFLKLHYLDHHQADGDEQEDNQLPFKSSEYQLAAPGFMPAQAIELNTSTEVPNLSYPLYLQPYALKDPLSEIFHPPRFA